VDETKQHTHLEIADPSTCTASDLSAFAQATCQPNHVLNLKVKQGCPRQAQKVSNQFQRCLRNVFSSTGHIIVNRPIFSLPCPCHHLSLGRFNYAYVYHRTNPADECLAALFADPEVCWQHSLDRAQGSAERVRGVLRPISTTQVRRWRANRLRGCPSSKFFGLI
jgi:hypothetical protein